MSSACWDKPAFVAQAAAGSATTAACLKSPRCACAAAKVPRWSTRPPPVKSTALCASFNASSPSPCIFRAVFFLRIWIEGVGPGSAEPGPRTPRQEQPRRAVPSHGPNVAMIPLKDRRRRCAVSDRIRQPGKQKSPLARIRSAHRPDIQQQQRIRKRHRLRLAHQPQQERGIARLGWTLRVARVQMHSGQPEEGAQEPLSLGDPGDSFNRQRMPCKESR